MVTVVHFHVAEPDEIPALTLASAFVGSPGGSITINSKYMYTSNAVPVPRYTLVGLVDRESGREHLL